MTLNSQHAAQYKRAIQARQSSRVTATSPSSILLRHRGLLIHWECVDYIVAYDSTAARHVDTIFTQRKGVALASLMTSPWRCIFIRATLCGLAVGMHCPSIRLSVRPSVCLSVTFVYCIQTAKVIVKLLSRLGSTIILIFWLKAPIPSCNWNIVNAQR